MRLPSALEWERAARGTDERVYPWGDEPPRKGLANYGQNDGTQVSQPYPIPDESDGWRGPAPVDSFPEGQSPYGAYNMSGNVSEWVTDLLLAFPPDQGTSKGGSWLWPPSVLAIHSALSPDIRIKEADRGFRCVGNLDIPFLTAVETTSWGTVKGSDR